MATTMPEVEAVHAPPTNTDEEDALREKLDTARRKRILNQKLSGKSLGEQLGGEEMDSAAAWVQRSRGIAAQPAADAAPRKVKRKPKPASAADRFDEMDDQAESSAGGAMLGHSIDDFKAGEEVTLTIADQSVLDGDDVNGGDDVLENVNMADLQRRDHDMCCSATITVSR